MSEQTRVASTTGEAALHHDGHGLVEKDHRDYHGWKMGMWLFLFTELLLFGGLFIVYAIYRHGHTLDFHNAAKDLDIVLGMINTMVLLTSSLTMAMSITALQKGQRGLSIGLVLFTVACGFVFMIIKYFEWSAKIGYGIYLNSPQLIEFPPGEILFYGLYYTMTGLHGLHVLIGMVLLSIVAFLLRNKPNDVYSFRPMSRDEFQGARLSVEGHDGSKLWSGDHMDDNVDSVKVIVNYKPAQENVKPRDYVALENCGLYWHIVDIVWIFLFPLFYLIT